MIKQRFARLAIAAALVSAVAIPTVSQAAPASAATQAATCRSQVFKVGSTGTCVRYIQMILNTKGLGFGNDSGKTVVDGIYGWGTSDLVQRLQQKWYFTQDGIVGPSTWIALCSPVAGEGKNAAQVFAGC